MKNLEKYKEDLEELLQLGEKLYWSMQYACFPDQVEEMAKKDLKSKAGAFLKKLPDFSSDYQIWYSEAKSVITQLLPDRLSDFVSHYEKPRSRKSISFDSYRIADYLQGTVVTKGWEKETVVDTSAAIPHIRQQLAILKSVRKRFESSLFDIQQLVRADLFDSELDTAQELHKHKFLRAAGAIAGVVLEKHLAQVCTNHAIKFRKKNLTISDFNDAMKKNKVIDVPQWRSIQYLGDIRNLCDHNKTKEPSADEVQDLINGVAKITKTLF